MTVLSAASIPENPNDPIFAEPAYSRKYSIGSRTLRFTLTDHGRGRWEIWWPSFPPLNLTSSEQKQYDAALADWEA